MVQPEPKEKRTTGLRGLTGLLIVAPLVAPLMLARPARAQGSSAQGPSTVPGGGPIVIPESSIEHPGDVGVRAHTHIGIAGRFGDTPNQELKEKDSQASQGSKPEAKPLANPKKGKDDL